MAQETFKRKEIKFLISREQYGKLMPGLAEHMKADEYGKYTISNIYFDTEDRYLIRTSLDKPVYKEKLRLRLYGTPAEDRQVFVELKKKYKGIVYKRRIPLTLKEARRYLVYGIDPDMEGRSFRDRQIFREIDYMKKRLSLKPASSVCYDRTALAGTEDPELRVTFDTNIRCRNTGLDLMKGRSGEQLLDPGTILMEVKVPGAFPIWMAELFERVIPGTQTSFSKYGTWYKRCLAGECGGVKNTEINISEEKENGRTAA